MLFADIDFRYEPSATFKWATFGLLVGAATLTGFMRNSTNTALLLSILAIPLSFLLASGAFRVVLLAGGGVERVARNRVLAYSSRHPEWSFHLYRTPAGWRALATHQTFSPDDPAVADCFSQLRVDPVYTLMCRNQQCFRARVSAKPWRIGIAAHMRPRPGVWPVAPQRMGVRNAWVEQYEAHAGGYAACHFIESVGSGTVAPAVRPSD